MVPGQPAAQLLKPCRRILEHGQDRVPFLRFERYRVQVAVDARSK